MKDTAVRSFLSQTYSGDYVKAVTGAMGKRGRAGAWPWGMPSETPAEGPSPD